MNCADPKKIDEALAVHEEAKDRDKMQPPAMIQKKGRSGTRFPGMISAAIAQAALVGICHRSHTTTFPLVSCRGRGDLSRPKLMHCAKNQAEGGSRDHAELVEMHSHDDDNALGLVDPSSAFVKIQASVGGIAMPDPKPTFDCMLLL